MAVVGIVANPAAGKDIRRLVAQGRFVPNHEKVNVLKRVLAGLDAVGVESVLFMPDSAMLGRGALDGASFGLDCRFVDMPVFHEDVDSTTATRLIREAGAGCIVTLGGDGTNRVVAKESGDIPILPISTGTNNVFPTTVEGTVAGMAAGLVATGAVDIGAVTWRGCRLELVIDGEPNDMALVDMAVSSERFVGSRAIWDIETLSEVFLCRADPSSIGLSAIGAQLKPLAPRSQEGVHIRLGPGGELVKAPVAPGIVQTVKVESWEVMSPGHRSTISSRPATIALDGERTLSLTKQATVEVVLSPDGPVVVDVDETMRLAAEAGRLRSGAFSARTATAGPGAHVDAAVHCEHLAGDPARFVGRQVQGRVRDVGQGCPCAPASHRTFLPWFAPLYQRDRRTLNLGQSGAGSSRPVDGHVVERSRVRLRKVPVVVEESGSPQAASVIGGVTGLSAWFTGQPKGGLGNLGQRVLSVWHRFAWAAAAAGVPSQKSAQEFAGLRLAQAERRDVVFPFVVSLSNHQALD